MPKVATYREFEEFCNKNTCGSCIMRHALSDCGKGRWIGQESRALREWGTMLIELAERGDTET